MFRTSFKEALRTFPPVFKMETKNNLLSGTVAKTLTCSELHKRSEKIAALLQERGKVNPGDHVALIFPPGLDLICAFYGCLYLGAVPITIRPPHPQNLITTLPTVRMIVDVSKSGIVLSIQNIIKLLKSREAAASIDPKSWPIILDIDDNPKRKLASIANCSLDSTAYLDFSVSTCGRLSGVTMTHRLVIILVDTDIFNFMLLFLDLSPAFVLA